MDIFIQHFKSDWKIDITKLDAKLLNIHQICRICFTTENISPIAEMEYEEISMMNIMKSFLPLELEPMDMVLHNLCSGCTNKLIHFYTFRENWKLSEEFLLTKDDPIQFVDDFNIDLQTIVVSNYSECEEVLDNSVPKRRRKKQPPPSLDHSARKAQKGKQPTSQQKHSQINKSKGKGDDCTAIIDLTDTNETEIKEISTDVKIKKKRVRRQRLHKYINKIKCLDCKVEYKTRELLNRHCKETGHVTKRLNRVCDICGKITTSSSIKEHMRTHTNERPFQCDQCAAAFTIKANLMRHMVIHTGQKSFICIYCKSAFNQKISLTVHIKSQHEDNSLKEATTIKTDPITKRSFNEYKCNECGRTFKRKLHFQVHVQKHKDLKLKWNTDNSGDGTENGGNSNYSIKNDVFDDNIEASANNDPIDSDNEQTYHSDMNSSHSIDTSTIICNDLNTERNNIPITAFNCDKCERGYPSNEQLKLHLITHGEKKYLCSDCGRGFTTAATLTSHIKVHTHEKPYKCTVCPKQFAHSGSLQMHMNVHTGNKPYRCDVCFKQFSQHAHLCYHMLLHTGQKSHVCSFCNKAFTLKGNLTVHMRTHTGETPYLCDVCGRGFYDSSSRKKHRKGHTEEEIAMATGTTETSVETVAS